MKTVEREAGKSYEQGWKTYGFAAPFTQHDVSASSVEVAAQ